jgi:hypothetical protein
VTRTKSTWRRRTSASMRAAYLADSGARVAARSPPPRSAVGVARRRGGNHLHHREEDASSTAAAAPASAGSTQTCALPPPRRKPSPPAAKKTLLPPLRPPRLRRFDLEARLAAGAAETTSTTAKKTLLPPLRRRRSPPVRPRHAPCRRHGGNHLHRPRRRRFFHRYGRPDLRRFAPQARLAAGAAVGNTHSKRPRACPQNSNRRNGEQPQRRSPAVPNQLAGLNRTRNKPHIGRTGNPLPPPPRATPAAEPGGAEPT